MARRRGTKKVDKLTPGDTGDLAGAAKAAARKRGPAKPDKLTPGDTIDAATRKRTATVKVGGKSKFPIPDAGHAKAALARINQAKPPLTSSQKAHVRAVANRVLGKAKKPLPVPSAKR